jgi:hypothetical protein
MMSEANGLLNAEAVQHVANTEDTPQVNDQAFVAQQPHGSTTNAPSASVPQMLLGGGL